MFVCYLVFGLFVFYNLFKPGHLGVVHAIGKLFLKLAEAVQHSPLLSSALCMSLGPLGWSHSGSGIYKYLHTQYLRRGLFIMQA